MGKIDISKMNREQAVGAISTVVQSWADGVSKAKDFEARIDGLLTTDGTSRMRVVDAALQKAKRKGLIVYSDGAWHKQGR